ncbi:penicillin-binding transpeptidase domain-containing protein [Wolbachia endosymbiont of Dirofilaria (Dirofilaria) immitis]|uniref:penicillin-binding transpeptidase domain-containing protein n=1 Tax=Wolbachia endosymbiont of Dirofilaria (Dirofilaria) immitis TaxID=1812115 RepID=UPI00158F60CF|nr:penicillin-binding transpeptidase domain-containing protein [Wolbachia endosymbiont of Dirofilaria (Dirofilaria) immitis]QKX02537.1 penicillin-binding protein [Wolbachia endosymbiont of Dirofilaria (Dirofilaria) immitis]
MQIKNKVFNRRVFILGGIQLTISVIFSCRLYNLQIQNRQKYEALSDNNRTRITTIIPKRGRILDRNGIELAVNKISYVVLFNGQKTFSKKVDLQTLSEIESKIVKPSEIKVTALYKRYYPFGSICSHTLGYTKKQQDMSEMGVSGIEYTYDNILKGELGKSKQEVNSKKRVIRELLSIPQQDGQDVQLTIDIDLQKKIAEIFKDHKGSIVVMDVNNGEILALYNSPSYDNNLFTSRLSNETLESLNTPSLPLINRALSFQIPPGSIFKIIVALAGLKDGIITPEEKFSCRGHMKIGERRFHCLQSKVHGYISLNEAIALSCNTYFYNIGKKISVDSLVETARNFGIGSGSLIGTFKEEAPGLLPDRNWRARKLYSEWYLGDTINLVIGQGYLLTTPLQLTVLAARIATGKEVIPHIEANKPIQDFSNINIDYKYLRIVQKAMFDAVNTKTEAYRRRPTLTGGTQIAGKTGTPEINSRGESHKLFIAYGPYYNPRYAISVFIEHGKTPRQDVAIANGILQHMFKK